MSVGRFIWYDLATSDPAAAARFYADVVGWTAVPVPDKPYTMFKMEAAILAGVHQMPAEVAARGVPPHWSGHIQVDDVDAALAQVLAAGGVCKFGPSDIEAVGRFAVVTDPQGAHFYLFTPSYTADEPAPMRPGSIGWRELRTADPAAALGFYGRAFGWQPSRAIEMEPMGTYQLFAYGGTDRGGIMAAPAGMMPHWLFYVVVDAVDAAVARVEAGGGTVVRGPAEVPGGARTLVCRDPQGGPFALVSAPALASASALVG